jgi:hypothetical protein
MFNKVITKISNWFTEPINGSLRKSPEMVAAKTEAGILKAEEDFNSPGSRSKVKSSRGSVRLVPRHYDEGPSPSKKRKKAKRK